MTGVLSGCGIALITLMMSVILSGMGFRGSRLVCILGTVLLYLVTLGMAEEVCGMILPLAEGEAIGGAVESVLKIIGVSYAASFAADTCRDMGEIGISNAVVAVGRVEILLIATPYALGITELAIELVGG